MDSLEFNALSVKQENEEDDWLSFIINETGRSPEPNQGKKKAFTHSSSWIGNVRYNPQNQTMRVMMNGKGYGFCGVPEKVYDSWEGSPSKGEFWWREIKDRYNCSSLMETEMFDIQWPPKITGYENRDELFLNYSPEGDRPDGITPDELTLNTEPYPTKETQSSCSNCKFYVEGGSCAIVEGVIDPNGISKFYEAGKPLPWSTQVFPVYEKAEANYQTKPLEPFLSETSAEDLGSKQNSQTPTIGVEPPLTNLKIQGYENENPNPDDIIFKDLVRETKLIRETVSELTQQFNWMTPDYLDRVKGLSSKVGGKFILVRASAEAITDHRAEGEPYRRLLKGDELAQLTRTGIGKSTDINHLGVDYKVDSDVLDAEYDPLRKETQMLVHLRDQEIINYIANGDIYTVSINAGAPRHMNTECNINECFVVPRGLILGELDGIAFTWVVNNPNGIKWQGRYIPPATPGVKTTKIEIL